MPDPVDLVIDYSATALAEHMAKRNSEARGQGCLFCEECEEEIPAHRRAAQPGCTLCTTCQAATEPPRR